MMNNNFSNPPFNLVQVIKWLLHPQTIISQMKANLFLINEQNNCLVCNKNPFNQLIYGYFWCCCYLFTLSHSHFKQRNPPRLIIQHTHVRSNLILSLLVISLPTTSTATTTIIIHFNSDNTTNSITKWHYFSTFLFLLLFSLLSK